jgi:GT2 family glycosyltransferase
MRLAFACPFYGPTYPMVTFGQLTTVMDTAAAGHVWVDNYSTNGMQHREACQRMLGVASGDDRIDALVWTEHDVVLPPGGVKRLIEALEQTPEADIVTGIVFRRSAPHSPMVCYNEVPTREQYERMKQNPSKQVREFASAHTYEELCDRWFMSISKIDSTEPPFPVDSASMGALVMRRRALEKVVDVPDLFDAEEHVSIDTKFFMRCRDRGVKTYCVPNVLCGHLADPQVVTINEWIACVKQIIEKTARARDEA